MADTSLPTLEATLRAIPSDEVSAPDIRVPAGRGGIAAESAARATTISQNIAIGEPPYQADRSPEGASCLLSSSCSEAALIGGGAPVRPGEITLAHGGVLFLDELPEFRRNAIEGLRPTMESGLAVVVRARERVTMPARPLVIGAMNPCPCGFGSW